MTAKTAVKAPAPVVPSALDIERQRAAEKERGRRLGADAAGELAQARSAFVRAEVARDKAVEAKVRGDDGGDELLSSALSDIRESAHRISEAEAMVAGAQRVYEQADVALRGVRSACVDELAEDAQHLVDAALVARDALREPLQQYMNAYRAAERRWRDLYSGAYGKVEQLDADRGFYRDEDKLSREASCPPCPLPVDVVAEVLGTTPRPPVFTEGYVPDAPAETYTAAAEPGGPQPLFKGDEGHQTGTLGVKAEPPGWPVNSAPPPTVADINLAAMERGPEPTFERPRRPKPVHPAHS